MSKNFKIFLIAFFVSFCSWWGIDLFQKDLEEIFYWNQISQNPEMFLAQVNIQPKIEKRNLIEAQKAQKAEELEIQAQSAISVLITPEGKQRILFQKNINNQRPIASLTKLMTALITQEISYEPSQILEISKKAVNQEEEIGQLSPGEKLSLIELLHVMLVESSNDAAWAIAESRIVDEESLVVTEGKTFIGKEGFVQLMNKEAEYLGLKNTYFANPTGLDGLENYSTSGDLVKLAQYILEKHPQIFEITKKQSYKVLKPDGTLHHFIAENTNELLGEIPGIVGGKTGFTEEAGGCFLLILENEKGSYLINVILGTNSPEERFTEMRKLVDCCKELL